MIRLLATLGALALSPPPLAADAGFGARLLVEIETLRRDHGVAALIADPALAAVAQARVDAMARDGWFGLASPEGDRVEERLDAAGYPFRLVTEKLLRTNASSEELGFDWRLHPDALRRSLLLPAVRRVGIGVADVDGERLIDIVLADVDGDETVAARTGTPLDAPVAAAALAAALDARRREHRRAPLRLDPRLGEAAQEHAEALLAALSRGEDPSSIETFGERLAEVERRRGAGGAGTASGGSKIWQRPTSLQSTSTRYGDGALGVGLVVDVSDTEEVLELLVESPSGPDLLAARWGRLGVGLAVGDAASGGRPVWVVAVARR